MTTSVQDPKPKRYVHLVDAGIDLPLQDQEHIVKKIHNIFDGPVSRVLFVQCPEISREHFHLETAKKGVYPCFPPYGLGVLVSALEENGYVADVIDLHYEVLASAVDLEEGKSFNFEVWRDKISEKISLFKPELIGLGMMFNLGHPELVEIARHITLMFPSIPIIAGGVHLSLTASDVLTEIEEIDFVILHEAENSLINFLSVVNNNSSDYNLTSVATKIDDRVIICGKRAVPETLLFKPNYKSLPIQDYSRVGRIGAYTFLRSKNAVASTVLSRRGCRAKCTFCSVRSVNGRGVRVRDHKAVVDEIQSLNELYGVSHLMWLDDDLFYDNEAAITLFRELEGRKLGITWDASNGIIASALNPELLEACVDSGCIGFNIGIESGNPEILRQMQKPGNVVKFIAASKLLHNCPQIFTKGFLIIGYPGENLAQLQDTVDLAKAMDLDWYPSQILTPMPGTPVHQLMLDQEHVSGATTDVMKTSKTFGKGRTFSVGVVGEIRLREMTEKESTRKFDNYFDTDDMQRVPTREELNDIWLVMDYRINYEPILHQSDVRKLEKKSIMLQEISERMTTENPLGTLFYGVCLNRLGFEGKAQQVIRQAEEYLRGSAFWRERFRVLEIDSVLDSYLK